jgi:hypothetical protein
MGKRQVTCPVCGFEGAARAVARWHGSDGAKCPQRKRRAMMEEGYELEDLEDLEVDEDDEDESPKGKNHRTPQQTLEAEQAKLDEESAKLNHDIFMAKFSREVEELVRGGCSILEAVLEWGAENRIDEESIAQFVKRNRELRDRLKAESLEKRLLKQAAYR